MSDNSSIRTDVSTIHLDNISLQNRENVEPNSRFIGFDLSTQQLKAIVIDENLRVCHHIAVSFDADLAEYKTRGGVYKSEDGSQAVSAPVNMWLKAIDMCFDKLKVDGLDFSSVACISGCAQQHGSVWWRRGSSQLLANLNPDDYLHKALVDAFTIRESPVWMDSSTKEECDMIERHLGGAQRVAELTGSRAYERFTGPQIAKMFRRRPEVYQATERICLISNFFSTVLCGTYTPFDASDASGMNMMDLKRKRWSPACLRAILDLGSSSEPPAVATSGEAGGAGAPPAAENGQSSNSNADNNSNLATSGDQLLDLRAKLGCLDRTVDENIVDTHEIVGRVSNYYVERYGFAPECMVSSFTGDNAASMAGLCLNRDELLLSLGTSDTASFWLEQPVACAHGQVQRNPLDDAWCMGLITFKNGSRTRERIRDTRAAGQWDEFSTLLKSVPRGNFGNIGFYFDYKEIYPTCLGDFRFNKYDQPVESFSNEVEVRACLEGQMMRLLHHSESLGLRRQDLRRVLVTGGASTNQAILQVVADVFRSPVYTLELPNSACLGAAYLAKFAYELERQKLDQSFEKLSDANEISSINFSDIILSGSDESDRSLTKVADPTIIGSLDVYEPLMERYVNLEKRLR